MGLAVVALLLVGAAVLLIRGTIKMFVCPFCGGEIERVFEKMRCRECGRLFFMWQARRR